MLRRQTHWAVATGFLSLLSGSAWADQYHYNNLLIGTRALGMGGAFAAIADDASGVHYNPAGIAYALSNDISGSANAFYNKKIEYKKVLGDDPFIEESTGSVAPFFGGLQKLEKYVPGLVAAFGVYHVDSDLKDQDTSIKDTAIGTSILENFHRTSNSRQSTTFAGAAVGYRPTPHVAVGFGVNYLNIDELVQEYQDIQQSGLGKNTDNTVSVIWNYKAQNIREHLKVYGAQPTLGIQISVPMGLALGLTVKKSIVASQSFEYATDVQASQISADQKAALDKSGRAAGYLTNGGTTTVFKKAVGSLPVEGRFGLAWFASPKFLWAFDVDYHGAVTDAKGPYLDVEEQRPRFAREAVVNYHTGFEWYVAPSFPLRAGAFTNRDARPQVVKGEYEPGTQPCNDAAFAKKYCNQTDHIDYFGESLFIAWVQPNTQTAAGVILQQGTGKGQKLAGSPLVQDVSASSLTFAFSATTSL